MVTSGLALVVDRLLFRRLGSSLEFAIVGHDHVRNEPGLTSRFGQSSDSTDVLSFYASAATLSELDRHCHRTADLVALQAGELRRAENQCPAMGVAFLRCFL